MTIHAAHGAFAPPAEPAALPAIAEPTPAWRGQRHDGWTPDRRRVFLEAVADGASIRAACGRVGFTVSSASQLRRAAAGADFAIGWAAANLLARDRIADTLVDRAFDEDGESLALMRLSSMENGAMRFMLKLI